MNQPVVLRRDALDQRLTRYFTGKPCPAGHIAERYTLSCKCIVCQKEDDEKRNAERSRMKRRGGSIGGCRVMVISSVNIPQF